MPTIAEIRTAFNAAQAAAIAASNRPLVRDIRAMRGRWRSGQDLIDDQAAALIELLEEPIESFIADITQDDFNGMIGLILPQLDGMVWAVRRGILNRLGLLAAHANTPLSIAAHCERLMRTQLVDQDNSVPPLLKFFQRPAHAVEVAGDAAVIALAAATTAEQLEAAGTALQTYFELTPDVPEPRVESPQ